MKLSGFKTYLVVAAGVVLNGLSASGQLDSTVLSDPNTINTANTVLGFLGLGALRSGVNKIKKK